MSPEELKQRKKRKPGESTKDRSIGPSVRSIRALKRASYFGWFDQSDSLSGQSDGGEFPFQAVSLFPFETGFLTLSSIYVITLRHKFGAINRVLLSTLKVDVHIED